MNALTIIVYWGILHESCIAELTKRSKNDPVALFYQIISVYQVHTLPAFSSLANVLYTNCKMNPKVWKITVVSATYFNVIQRIAVYMTG